MTVGYNQPLYILPFDHRASFRKGLFGWDDPLAADQVARVTEAKQVVYEGFKAGLANSGIPKEYGGILVDEQFGASILADAARAGIVTSAPAEKSGLDEFDFEYGDDFGRHIEAVNPTFCKVLVRYNPEGESAMNARQATRLRALSEYLHAHGRLYMFELLVPPERAQLAQVDGDRKAYDRALRPYLTTEAIMELQDAGVDPDVWKIEGLETSADWQEVTAVVRRDGRNDVGCIVLGRGETDEKVMDWLRIAAGSSACIGFAVGRTTFWEPLVAWRDGRLTKEQATQEIGSAYAAWIAVFEDARSSQHDERLAA